MSASGKRDYSADDSNTAVGYRRWYWEIFCIVICAYPVAIILGFIRSDNRLSSSEIALLGIVAFGTLLRVSPQWLDKLGKVKVGSLELELTKVQRAVTRVDDDLEQLRLMLAVTLPPLSQELLICGLQGKPYLPVDESVKKAVRRLADQSLFVRRPEKGGAEKRIANIAAGESFLETVALTEQGRRVAEVVSRVYQKDEPEKP